jgi:hypothetical protein
MNTDIENITKRTTRKNPKTEKEMISISLDISVSQHIQFNASFFQKKKSKKKKKSRTA